MYNDFAFHNMCCSPRSKVIYDKNTETKLVFDPRILLKKFKCTTDDIKDKIEDYIKNNPNVLLAKNKVDSYLIGESVPIIKFKDYPYFKKISDINFLITIIGKTTNGMYIPNKKLTFEKEKFENILVFRKDDFGESK